MENVDLVPAEEFCTYHQISYTFIATLEEAGIIDVIAVDKQSFLHTDQLKEIEKLIRLYTDLQINIEGIETIAHMLKRMNVMQEQLKSLERQLRFYEGGGG